MLTVEDRLEIADLYARYAHTVDGADHDGWCACFTPDGSLAVPVNEILVRGPEALGAFSRAYAARSGGLERHLVSNLTVVADGAGARGSCYLAMLVGGSGTAPPRLTTTGTYRDELRRTADGWRFAARVLHVDTRPDG